MRWRNLNRVRFPQFGELFRVNSFTLDAVVQNFADLEIRLGRQHHARLTLRHGNQSVDMAVTSDVCE
jgi:hypothetical protein